MKINFKIHLVILEKKLRLLFKYRFTNSIQPSHSEHTQNEHPKPYREPSCLHKKWKCYESSGLSGVNLFKVDHDKS